MDPAAPLPVAPLEYAGTLTVAELPPPWRTAALRVVLLCWAVPLGIGSVIFVGALCSGPSGWEVAGVYNILFGTALAAVGGIATLVFAASRWQRAAGDRWRRVVGPAVAAGLLLASNFAVAAVMIAIVV